jgi:hypothetical protein
MPNYTALPSASQVQAVLAALNPPVTIPSGFVSIIQDEVNGATIEWNDRTHYQPFYVPSDAVTQSVAYNPPGPDKRYPVVGGGYELLLRNGLISATSIYNVVDPSSPSNTGNLLSPNIDYWLEPALDPNNPTPFTKVVFGAVQRGLRQSIVITGLWGYAQNYVPDDAWVAIRDLCCARCCETLLEGFKRGIISWTDRDVRNDFDPKLVGQFGEGFRNRAEFTLFRYRLQNPLA